MADGNNKGSNTARDTNNYVSKQPREGGSLRLTWTRSAIGYSQHQRLIIKSLGFHRLHETLEVPDTAQMRGQVWKVKHMLQIEEI